VVDVVTVPVELETADLFVGLVVELHEQRRGTFRIDSKVDPLGRDRGAELFGAAAIGDKLRFHDAERLR
jgi:hypothetical protein